MNAVASGGQLDGDLGGAGAEVEDLKDRWRICWSLQRPVRHCVKQIGDKLRVDDGVVHRVVFVRVLVVSISSGSRMRVNMIQRTDFTTEDTEYTENRMD